MKSCLLRPSTERFLSDRVAGGIKQRANLCLSDRSLFSKWAESEKKHQREIRRLRQIRYRKKKEDYTNQISEENQQLREQIKMLEERRRIIVTTAPSKNCLAVLSTVRIRQ
ncbi:hypothetical protein GN244_ATG12409 [Phytophthora infestans]|uniref:BZIP domain-containing protein n=1 Tax=Phytophthora infestans TaxID=4787 RepID=A0A833SQ88_PHYIN|nr:hypothetical protein GN244_ATG12409 [Phytophthora infestans]